MLKCVHRKRSTEKFSYSLNHDAMGKISKYIYTLPESKPNLNTEKYCLHLFPLRQFFLTFFILSFYLHFECVSIFFIWIFDSFFALFLVCVELRSTLRICIHDSIDHFSRCVILDIKIIISVFIREINNTFIYLNRQMLHLPIASIYFVFAYIRERKKEEREREKVWYSRCVH